MAGRSAPGGTAALFGADCRSCLRNLYHARVKQERSGAHRRSRPASRERHSNYGSIGMESPPRLSAERSHDCGRGEHGSEKIMSHRNRQLQIKTSPRIPKREGHGLMENSWILAAVRFPFGVTIREKLNEA